MSTNRHALIRYRTIDQCLRDRERNYNLQGLIDACSKAISEHNGVETEVKRRTVLYDLKFMKDDVSGFSAPIRNDRKEGYYYERADFSIFLSPIKKNDLDTLKATLRDLQRISGKEGFDDLHDVILRLEETYNIRRNRNESPVIHFEQSTNIEGQKYVSAIRKHILDNQPLQIKYKPFDAKPYVRYISPYLLKEYNNRWFLIGYEYDSDWGMTVVALDRIKHLDKSLRVYHENPEFDPETWNRDIIGVTLPQNAKKVKVIFKAFGKARRYMDTKPLHHSQKLIKDKKKFAEFSINVIPNPELESKLLAYGEALVVLGPPALRKRMAQRLAIAAEHYSVVNSEKPVQKPKKEKKGKKKKK